MDIEKIILAGDRRKLLSRLLVNLPPATVETVESWARQIDLLRSEANGIFNHEADARQRLSVAYNYKTQEEKRQISNLRSKHDEIREAAEAEIQKHVRRCDDLLSEVKQFNDRLAEKNAIASSLSRTIESIIAYAKQQSTPVAVFSGRPPKAAGTEAALNAARERVTRLKNELASVEVAPFTSAEAKARVREQVELLATRGRPNVAPTVESGETFRFASMQRLSVVEGETKVFGVGGMMLEDAIGLIAWLHKDTLIAALEREIDKLNDDEVAMSEADRRRKMAELKAAILAAERQEEAEIAGQTGPFESRVLRRPDADVRAILSLADNAPAFRERPF